MAYTYDVSTALGKVRLHIGDTDTDDILFTDEEINVYLTNNADVVLDTAADLCEVLATRYSREYDFETDQQKFSRSQRVKQYKEMATALRERATGISVATTTRTDGYSDDLSTADASTSNGRTGHVRAGYFNPDAPY